ncbi:MAG TPA: glutamine synthetase III, partial [bacterium]|nr:glutamine synthetase III [bacterium]
MSIKTSGANLRQQVLLTIAANNKIDFAPQTVSSPKIFGVNSFNEKVMREKMPKDVYNKLRATIRKGEKLDMAIADVVAHAMKEWALSKGVSHFTHWFQPQTGLTAEKH